MKNTKNTILEKIELSTPEQKAKKLYEFFSLIFDDVEIPDNEYLENVVRIELNNDVSIRVLCQNSGYLLKIGINTRFHGFQNLRMFLSSFNDVINLIKTVELN